MISLFVQIGFVISVVSAVSAQIPSNHHERQAPPPIGSPSETGDAAWITVGVNESKSGFRLRTDRKIEHHGRVLIGPAIQNWSEQVEISPLHASRYALAVPVGQGDAGQAYLLDVKNGTNHELRARSPFYRLAAWSPDASVVLLASSYETDVDLHLVSLAAPAVSDVALPRLAVGEVPIFQVERVSWMSNDSVVVPAYTVCNRYNQEVRRTCDPSVILRLIDLVVDVRTKRAALSENARPMGRFTVVVQTANLREWASATSRVIRQARRSSVLDAIGQINGWVEVLIVDDLGRRRLGYVLSSLGTLDLIAPPKKDGRDAPIR